ncbi:MAG: OmpA family protein [Bacteroidales bacterium]|nr:OmpA family protein [Bacteroidales bacterium]
MNSSEIKLESAELLDYIYDILDYSYYDLQINGYADESGTDIYNLKLSQERADQVKEYFKINGIDPVRLKSNGKGEIKSSIEMNKSRKVEFILYKKGSI